MIIRDGINPLLVTFSSGEGRGDASLFIYPYVSQIIENMKYLRTIDFVGQTMIWLTMVISSIWMVAAEGKWSGIGLIAALTMLVIGFWQGLSALIMLGVGAPNQKYRKLHGIMAMLYLGVSLTLTSLVEINEMPQAVQIILYTLAIAIPVGLAIFYYSITWLWMFPTQSSGKFLRHISF